MDSAGRYLPSDVTQRITALVDSLDIPVGFHAHNNLGMGIANSVAAVQAGATITTGALEDLVLEQAMHNLKCLLLFFSKWVSRRESICTKC